MAAARLPPAAALPGGPAACTGSRDGFESMSRILLVFIMAALLCLGLTGLRVVVLEHLATPAGQLVAPRPVDDGEPPSSEPPVESIADTRAPRLDASAMIVGPATQRRSAF